ncbi:CHAT domain-containing protein [Streptomyces sp. NPDC001407]|uniref:CHAT domain-containing protein n=1 Tax=Streptomyces sp. NPDC001407 TaxID=3364573 RepID=UPI0036B6839C
MSIPEKSWKGFWATLRGPSRQNVPSGFTDDFDPVADLSNRSIELLEHFERTGDPVVLDEAIDLGRAAIRAVTESYPYKAIVLSNLSTALESQFGRTGDLATVDEAIDLIRSAIRATRDDSPHQAALLYNLGNSLWRRFDRTGAVADLDEAIGAYRAAVHATPDSHPKRARRMSNLGTALKNRFDRTGDLGALDEAVELLRTAVGADPDNAPGRNISLQQLGLGLEAQFDLTGRMETLDDSIEMLRAAVRAALDPLHRSASLANLGAALRNRFEQSWEMADLDEAIKVGRAAVRTRPDEDPDSSVALSHLCNALVLRFEHTGKAKALEEAVKLGRAAVRATPDDHPGISNALASLGHALKLRHTHKGAEEDRVEAVSVWERAAGTTAASASMRIDAARAAGHLAASSDPRRAAGILERAVLLLPEVAPRRLKRGDQQQALIRTRQLAADAIAQVLADSGVDARQGAMRALGLAEAGRAVLLSQTLDTRSDLSELRHQHPDLAVRFNELRELLDQDDAATTTLTGTSQVARLGHERHRLAAELEALLERIRACEGFAAFGRPPILEELLPDSAHGPVVTFNVNRYRSDALLLTRHGVSSCPLPRLTVNETLGQVDAFYTALDEARAPAGDRVSAQRALRRVLEWLWDAAAEPVLSALTALGELGAPPGGEPLPRLWWTLAGPLGVLPLHAAGYHTKGGEPGGHRRTVMDRVISSYTPTIRTLHHTRQHSQPPSGPLRSLIIAMPDTPGLDAPLRHVREEARRVKAHLPHPVQLIGPEPGSISRTDTPTAAAVRSQLPHCAIAHFACHGVSDSADPSQSRLLLYDHATSPLTVAALAQLSLGQGQLAYLSACSTAAPGDRQLSDEAIHLTSACQLAGFTHVIGTLWPINDRLAVDIAESFYTYLATGPSGPLAPDRAATALHHTIQDIRDRYPGLPSLWAAYLHVGA